MQRTPIDKNRARNLHRPANTADKDYLQQGISSASRQDPGSSPETSRDSTYRPAGLSRNVNTARSADDNNTTTNEETQSKQRSADRTQNFSNSTTMTSEAIIESRIEMDRILCTIEDELLSAPARDDYPVKFIEQNMRESDVEKTKLTKLMATMRHKDTEYYNNHYRDDITRLEGRLGDHIRDGQKHLQRRFLQAPPNSQSNSLANRFDHASDTGSARSAATLRTRRVNKFYRPLIQTSLNINDKLKEIIEADVTSDREAESLQDKLNLYLKEADDHIKELQNLASDAYSSNMDVNGIALENSAHNMKKKKSEAQTALMALRATRGMDSRAGHARQRLTDLKLKIPTYGGEMTAGKLDFYTFKTEMNDYFKAKCLTKEEEGELLKKSALVGAARTQVYHLTDADEIWESLRESFGMIEEVKKHARPQMRRRRGSGSSTHTPSYTG